MCDKFVLNIFILTDVVINIYSYIFQECHIILNLELTLLQIKSRQGDFHEPALLNSVIVTTQLSRSRLSIKNKKCHSACNMKLFV